MQQRRHLIVLIPTVGMATALGVLVVSMLAISAIVGSAAAEQGCSTPAITPAPIVGVPPALAPIFEAAAARYELGSQGAAILAGLTSVESGFGQNMGPSSAGATGWTQFMPATWTRWGIDANHDGRRDPYTAADAIFSSARYLQASGAPGDWYHALFAYNHADSYVTAVLDRAKQFSSHNGPLVAGPPTSPTPAAVSCEAVIAPGATLGPITRKTGPSRLAALPGQPGMRVDSRILADVVYLTRTYHLSVTAAYATSGHEPNGEHPLGLAVDVVPGPGGSWDDVDRLAHWAEPAQNAPRPPFRWVGYDGDPGHGRGNHLHLSWMHAPAPTRRPPVAWVDTFATIGVTA